MGEKRYYWLKLKEDFFDKKEIKKLRKIAGGDTYTIIYMKMLLLSLRDNGKLYYDGIEDTFEDELALILDEDAENVKVTIAYLLSVGLMEEMSDTEARLTEIPVLIGSESWSAERMRRHRERQKTLAIESKASQCDTQVTASDEDIDIEKEIEIEKEIDKHSSDLSRIISAWNELPVTNIQTINPGTKRYTMVRARISEYGMDKVLEAINIISQSSFLLGRKTDFVITFDWFIKPNNFIKVYEGNYIDRKPPAEEDWLEKWARGDTA